MQTPAVAVVVPPVASPAPAKNKKVRGGGAPPKLDAPTGPRGKDVIADESWRHDPARTADWFAPSDPVSPDVWAPRRADAHFKTVNTVVADVTTDSTPSKIKSYQGLVNYDLRRIEVAPGKFVQDYTVKVHLKPGKDPDVDAQTIADLKAKAKTGVDDLLNQGFRLPSGDQFHLNLEFTNDPKDAHTTIEVGKTGTDQTHWNPNSSPNLLAHETLHYLGVPDEYSDSTRVFQQHATNSGVHLNDGGMMGRDVLGNDPGLRPRHLWLVERAANSQVAVPDTLLDDPGPTSRPPTTYAPPVTTAPAPAPDPANPGPNAPNPNATPPETPGSRPAPSGGKRKRDGEDGVDTDMDVDTDTDARDVSKRPRTDTDPITGVTWDNDVNAPLDPAADVEMPDADATTGTDAAGDVNGPVVDLQSNATTKFNDAFKDLANGRPVHLPTPGGYLADLDANVKNDKPVGFVVNAIVPIKDIDADSLRNVIGQITADAKGLDGKVAFVIGVNTRGDLDPNAQAAVEAKLAELEPVLADIDVPVALTGFTWKMPSSGNLPYGTMRNETLDSAPNKFAISAMANNGSHPYIAVQDFDLGSRNVPSGQHVFNHVIDSMKGPDGLPPARPLMFSGGYRTPDLDTLVQDVEAKLQQTGGTIPDPEAFKSDFARKITQDMDARVEQAKTSPMLPYTPEPNLFFDGVAPMVDPTVRFGDGGAEFSMLGRSLNNFFANELGAVYDQKIADIEANAGTGADGDVDMDADVAADVADQKDVQLSQLAVDAQTYSHPIRTQAFISDFKGGAVETDLTRIAVTYVQSGSLPQTHAALGGVADRFFHSKKDKGGTSLGGFRDKFPQLAAIDRDPTNLAADPVPKLNPNPALTAPPKGNPDGPPPRPSTAPQFKETAKVVKDLGVTSTHKIDQAMSKPVPGHPDVIAGLDQRSRIVKAVAGVNTAMSGPEASMQRRFAAMNNIANLPSTLPPAPNGLYDAVGKVRDVDPAQLRDDVTGYVSSLQATPVTGPGKETSEAQVEIRKQLANFITDNPTTNGDLVNSVVQPGPTPEFDPSVLREVPGAKSRDVMAGPDVHPDSGPVETGPLPDVPDPSQVRADAESAANADHIAAQALATQLRTPIVVHHPSGPPTTYTPFGTDLPQVAPIEVDAVQGPTGRSTYTPHVTPASGPDVVGTRPAPTQGAPGTRPAPTPDVPGTRPAPTPDVPSPSNTTTPDTTAPTSTAPTSTAPGTTSPDTAPPGVPDTRSRDLGTDTRTDTDTDTDADVQPPNAPRLRFRPTPNPVIPMATLTPPNPGPVLTTKNLPDFFQGNQALGTIAPVDVQGAPKVAGAVNGLRADDKAAIESALTSDFESFLGNGRNFQVKIGRNWFEANVQATMMPPADPAAAVTTPGTTTKVDMTAQSGTATSTTTNLTTANDVGAAATAGVAMGPYGSIGGKAQLATPATGITSSTATTDQRIIRSGEGSTTATVPVSYRITLTDAQGNAQPPITVDSDPAGPVDVTLQIPDDLSTIVDSKPTLAANPNAPRADWGARVEHAVPEAVTDVNSTKAFSDVAAKLHPSITKIGSPGRAALQTFLSPTTMRDNMGAMLTGWVTSPDLVSPHASKGSAVQARATLKGAELVGVHDASQLRLHDSTSSSTGVTATTKTGFDATAGFGGNIGQAGVLGGQVGVTATYSARTADSSNAGTNTVNKTGIQLKGQTGLYKVTADVEVRTPSGANVTVPVTTYMRLGLPEAAALDLPVPDGTRKGTTKPTDTPRFAPPYLDSAFAAGNARVGDFEPANRVQSQVEAALKNVAGFKDFLPNWNDPNANPRSGKGQGFADVAQQLANQRKLNLLSPTALKSNMDSLLGPGVNIQLKNSDATTSTYVNVTVKAKLSGTTHLGQADARNIRGASSSGPKLDSATATTKGWSGGVEGKVVIPVKTANATLTPTPQFGAKYNHSWTSKNTGGPTVNSTSLNVGSPDAQVFQGDVEFEVEITTFTRPRSWVQRVTPGLPGRQAPQPRVVARTVGASLDPAAPNNPEILPAISGKVNVWVSDSSALKVDPKGFKPGDPQVTTLTDAPTVKDLLTNRTKPASPEFLHVEAVANTTALRDQAIDALNRAANGDSALTVPGTESRNQIDRMFSPENIKANLRKLVETGMQEQGLKYDRRVTDRTGSVGMSMTLGNPKLVSIADDTGTENAVTGGYKAGDASSTSRSVDITGGVNVPIRPNATPPPAGEPTPTSGAGGVAAVGKYTPWADSKSQAREVAGSVDRNVVTPPAARTVLIQLDADVTIVGESRAGNVVHGGTPRAEGASVKLPKSVFVRVSEDVARELGVLPNVAPTVGSPDFGGMAPPKTLAKDEPGSLGLSAVDKVPDLSAAVDDLVTQVNAKTSKRFGDPLVPDSVLKDSMNNLQRLVDFSSPASVKAMIDSALDGGVPLLVHQPGTFGKDSFQVTLRAKAGEPKFDRVVNDGVDVEHTIAGAEKVTTGQGRGSGWGVGVKAPGLASPGSANPNVSGTAGVIASANYGHAKSSTVTDATTHQFGHLRAGSGPAAKYTVPVEFELVVERGDKEIARATTGAQEMGIRLHADNQRVADPAAGPTPPYMAAAIKRGAEFGTPTAARAWQQAGSPSSLPPNASVENLRGAKDLRDAAVKALTDAGAKPGITGKGSGPLNTLLATLSSENLQPGLPGMLDGPLDVPGLHEAALTFGQDADVKVYAKLVNPRLGALSDGVNLENPVSVVSTTSGEAKVTESADVSVGFATGSAAVKQGTDPKDTVNFTTGGVEVRHAAEDSQAVSGGATDNKVNNLKAQGRTGLVEFDVEYRVVATIGGRTGVVDLAVPGSAAVRMPAPEAQTVLGKDFDPELAKAQDDVKAAAKSWRDAEVAVDKARHAAQDAINAAAAELAKTDAEMHALSNDLNGVIGTAGTESGKVDGLAKAVDDAHDSVADLQQRVKDLNTEVGELDVVAQNADEALRDATADVESSADTVADLEFRLGEAREKLDTAKQDLDAAEKALADHRAAPPPVEGAPPVDPAVERGLADAVDTAKSTRDGVRAGVDRLGAELDDAKAQHSTDLDAQRDAKDAAERANADLERAEGDLKTARDDLKTARDTLDQAKTDLRDQQRTVRDTTADRDAKQARYDVLLAARDAQEARIAAAEVVLNDRRQEADARQQAWWDAKRVVDQRVDTYNATPAPAPVPAPAPAPAPSNDGTPPPPPGTPVVTPPAAPPLNRDVPVTQPGVPQVAQTDAAGAPPAARAVRGPGPERSFDLPPGATDLPPADRAVLDTLAKDLVEQNGIRDRKGYQRPTVAVTGPDARLVADALAAHGVDATVRDTTTPTTDVHVDWELKRTDGWTPPAAPVGAKVTDTVITSSGPAAPHPVLDDPSWRHSTAPTADWFANPAPASDADIGTARAGAPITGRVRGEDGGVMNTTTVGRDGVKMKAWRGPIAYDTRVLDVNGTPVRDFTVRVHLDPAGHADPAQLADVRDRTRAGVDRLFNQGHRLPSGEQFHVTVEFTTDPADAHATVKVAAPDGRANQLSWPVDTDPRRLAHEVGHFLGLHDEYFETGKARPIFQHQDGKGRVMGDNAPMTDGIDEADASLKPRNLWLVENRMRALESSNDPAAVWTDPSAVVPAPGTTDAGTTDADTSADQDVRAPNAPRWRSRPAPTPAVPLVTITPPARQAAELDHQRAVRERADLETRITTVRTDLAQQRDAADVQQANWWNAKTEADRRLATFTTPSTGTPSTGTPPPAAGTTTPRSGPASAPTPGAQTFGAQTFGAPAATATSTFGTPTASTFGAPAAGGTPTPGTPTPGPSSTAAQRDAAAAALTSRHQSERTAESNAVAARQAAEKQAEALALQAKQQADYNAESAAVAARLDAERLKAEADLLTRQQQDRVAESNALAARLQAEYDRVSAELAANQQAHRQQFATQVLANQKLEREQVEAQIQQQLAVAPGSFDPDQVRQQVLNNQAAFLRTVEQQLNAEQAAERQRVEQELVARQDQDRKTAEQQLDQRQLVERQQAAQQLKTAQDAERLKAEQDLKARQLLEQRQAEAALDTRQAAERKAEEDRLNARHNAEHAAELARWLPPGTKHAAAFADDNAAATWANTAYPGLSNVNRVNFENNVPGHNVNCTNCVIATHETLHGRPVAAPPLPAPAPGTYLEATFASTFRTVANYHEVVDHLAAQPGRHVSIGITRPDGTGHVFNAWNDRGDITFFDSQNNRPADLERDVVTIQFIPLPDLPQPAPPPTAAAPTAGPVP
ncbi:toxin glutamine deamidase domain-containing protein [Saccharothrix longispora]|uniref:toxin glutamine deamidase domain-containing protein n=1 Tax=Saccharothrix longispora TaxID=33920 RepID=UPI00286B042E|nr:toxin glutamine deamidase domain-containing protein [Saccharothrix longispora]